MRKLFDPLWTGWLASAVSFALMAAAGPYLGGYAVSVLTLVFLFAFFGQAWNLILGFAGQLSLGQALFAGIGSYTTFVLLLRYGVSPWFGIPAGAALACAAGALIGWLGFRFALRGIHFALLTISIAECARVLFANWDVTGGTAGLFLPVMPPGNQPLISLRGDGLFYYEVTLGLAVAGTGLTAWLGRSRLGYIWRAMRDDEPAARALGVRVFRHKILATALSAAMTGLGGAVYGLMSGVLFPDSMMGMGLSIEIIAGPIIGGLGTAFGPLIGALFAVVLEQIAGHFGQAAGMAGLSTLAYGLALVLIVWLLPHGIWAAMLSLFRRHRLKAAE